MQDRDVVLGRDRITVWLHRVRDFAPRDRGGVARALERLEVLGRYGPAMLPLLIPLLVQLVYRALVSTLVLCDAVLGIEPVCASPAALSLAVQAPPAVSAPAGAPPEAVAQAALFVAAEMETRMAWLATVVLLLALCLVVWGMGCYWVVRSLDSGKWRSVPMLAGAAGLAWVITRVSERSGGLGGIQNYVVDRLFLSQAGAFLEVFGGTAQRLPGLCLLLSAAAVTVGLAACATVGRSCEDVNDPARLSESMRNLQHVLFAGALLLIAAVIEFRTLFTWAAASTHAGNAEAITRMGTVAAATLGVVYAVGLAAVYFPAALVLSKRARDRAREALGDAPAVEVDAWLAKNGLVISTPKSLSTVVAVLSPLLAQAPAAALLDLLK